MINQFTTEVCDEIGYYVYRLVDPRDGTTFYVGKGKDNRLFAHINCEISLSLDEEIACKYRRIREIKDAGLEVIHIIQRWHLSEKEAIVVESALIDVYSLCSLTNLVKGANNNYGVCNAKTLQRELSAEVFVENQFTPKFMIIKVQQWRLNETNCDRYEATRSAWKVNPKIANNYPYVLSVTNGLVYEVYEVEKWVKTETPNRFEFVGSVAKEIIRENFIDKKIPEVYRKKGQASPFLYSK